MNKKEKESLIKDITALVNTSDNLARSLKFKALELKDMYRQDIDTYKRIKGMIEGSPLNIEFELKNKKGTWTVSIPGSPNFDTRIIPNEIITHITNNPSNPGIIGMVKDFESKDGRKFDFTFDKKSLTFISGTISEKREDHSAGKDLPGRSTSAKMSKIEDLFIYLKDNEGFLDWLIGQFYTNWKPLIDSGFTQESK